MVDAAVGPGVTLRVERQSWLGAPALSYAGAPSTILHVLDTAVRRFADKTFLEAPEGSLTYAEFAMRVEATATELRRRGVGPGDRFAVAAVNGLDLAIVLFAAARAGAIMVGLNTSLAPTQWKFMIQHSGAAIGFAQPGFAPGMRTAAEGLDLDIADLAQVTASSARWEFDAAAGPDPSSTYAVVYTSGTTGRPKASQVVHRCSVHSAMSYASVLEATGQDRTAVLFQLFYISAMHAHLLPMALVGGCCTLIPGAGPAAYLRTLSEQRITWAYAVPSMWLLLLRDAAFRAETVPHLRRLGFGGSPFPPGAVSELRSRLPGVRLLDIYGLSETHSPATMLLDHEFAFKPGSVGRPLPCMEARLVDDEGRPLEPGQAGELLLRGSLVTTGYLGDQAATTAAIEDGWFRTGDIARIDSDGYVYILDRKKDMITRGGQKVFSAEVERVLRDHPAVDDAGVVGLPDPVAFESVVAFVVPRSGVDIDKGELRRWIRDRLSEAAVPRRVHVVASLPRNPTGKLEKATLRRIAGDASDRA